MPHKEGRREREKCANAGMGENVLVGGEINEITDNFEKLDALDNSAYSLKTYSLNA
jgi:hypothetical protein